VGETKTVEGLYTKVPSKPLPNPAPLTPQAGQPWTNSLGMRFAPLPGTPNLLSIWDTRVMDYRAFVASANYTKNMGWTNATYANSEANPVVFVSYEDAVSFCLWLTTNAQSKGILKTNQFYCLPSDQDWSRAVGIPPEKEKGATPKERSEDVPDVYPWGKWPPPKDTGNFQAKAKLTPVGSFPPIRGFYDLSGNVWQWCSDLFDNPPNQDRVLRGGAWDTTRPNELLSSFRSSLGPHINTRNNVGFRCLLNLGDGGTPESHLRP